MIGHVFIFINGYCFKYCYDVWLKWDNIRDQMGFVYDASRVVIRRGFLSLFCHWIPRFTLHFCWIISRNINTVVVVQNNPQLIRSRLVHDYTQLNWLAPPWLVNCTRQGFIPSCHLIFLQIRRRNIGTPSLLKYSRPRTSNIIRSVKWKGLPQWAEHNHPCLHH